MPRVFISHASANAELALRICEGLESRGVPCWIAPRDVAFDGTYGPEIMKGLRECDVFLIVVTEASAESQQVEREAERASHYKKRIIPVIIGQGEPGQRLEFYVAGRQQFACPSVPDRGFLTSLADAIDRETPHQKAPAPPRQALRRKLLFPALAVAILGAIGAGYVILRPPPAPATVDSRGPSDVSQPPPSERTSPDAAAQNASERRSQPTSSIEATANVNPLTASPGREPAPSATPVARPAAPDGAMVAVVNGVQLRFVSLPAGDFRMGCSAGDTGCEDDEKPVRRVAVDAFQLGATEVTQELWETVMGSNPSDFHGTTSPVEHISWQDSQDFVERLNRRRDGFTYRLPTEAEWEYAARAGDSTPPDLAAVAWFGLASSSARSSRPQSAATKAPNRWGLYDMLGNVAEWCEDWYSPNYQRVARGGSWVDSARSLRVSARGKAVPTTRDYSIGVRLVRQPQ